MNSLMEEKQERQTAKEELDWKENLWVDWEEVVKNTIFFAIFLGRVWNVQDLIEEKR